MEGVKKRVPVAWRDPCFTASVLARRAHRHRIRQRDIGRRVADIDVVAAVDDLPLLHAGIEDAERVTVRGGIDGQLYLLFLTWLQPYLLERDEALGRLCGRGRESEIDLRHLRAGARAGVLDEELYEDRLGTVIGLRRHFELRDRERRIGKAV